MILLVNLLSIVLCSVVIMYACDSFELASRRLGKHFPEGIRGATINAVGSSLPELFASFFLLFYYHDKDGFAGGIATCAGSAIFNAVVIPALCILSVLIWGVKGEDGVRKVTAIKIKRSGLLRDGIFFLICCVSLIFLLSGSRLSWWMGGLLVLGYCVYVVYLYIEFRAKRSFKVGNRLEEEKDEEVKSNHILHSLLTLDFHFLLYNRAPLTTSRAWVLLFLAILFIALPCHFLVEACYQVAQETGVPLFFTAVILAAAATSVPDTILSVKDARTGDYDDAISNAFGSNIFDITICVGLPLFFYGLIYGDVSIVNEKQGFATIQELQIVLFLITLCVLAIFLMSRTLGKGKAYMLFGLYCAFLVYCFVRVSGWAWLGTQMEWVRSFVNGIGR